MRTVVVNIYFASGTHSGAETARFENIKKKRKNIFVLKHNLIWYCKYSHGEDLSCNEYLNHNIPRLCSRNKILWHYSKLILTKRKISVNVS